MNDRLRSGGNPAYMSSMRGSYLVLVPSIPGTSAPSLSHRETSSAVEAQ